MKSVKQDHEASLAFVGDHQHLLGYNQNQLMGEESPVKILTEEQIDELYGEPSKTQ